MVDKAEDHRLNGEPSLIFLPLMMLIDGERAADQKEVEVFCQYRTQVELLLKEGDDGIFLMTENIF